MPTFNETIQINAGPEVVWAVLADIGNIAEWNPGLIRSEATNVKNGVGATRHCVINASQSLDEEVVYFDPPHGITFRIKHSTMPFESADVRFTLAAGADCTIVNVSPEYTIKYRFFGRLLDKLIIKRVYRKGMMDLLRGLKDHTEARVGVVSQSLRLIHFAFVTTFNPTSI